MLDGKLHNINGVFRFKVELDGLLVGGFSEVTGLQAETALQEYQEGGVNNYVHQFPKQTKFPKIVLKRGLTGSGDLWEWYESVIAGKVKRKNGSIIMYSRSGHEVCRWNFFDAYPVKWAGPDFNATNNNVAIESIELVHNGLKTIHSKMWKVMGLLE
jgi:phage tail-like protein